MQAHIIQVFAQRFFRLQVFAQRWATPCVPGPGAKPALLDTMGMALMLFWVMGCRRFQGFRCRCHDLDAVAVHVFWVPGVRRSRVAADL
eukprot:SAG31_NODE_1034_length_10228_cov_89.107316_7_plen_89_part_00